MRNFLYWILVITACGCAVKGPRQNNTNCEKQKFANEIRHKVADQLKRDFDLIPFGSGAQMMYQIEMLALAFQYAKPVTIESGRAIAVAAVNEFIAAVNGDERVRPFLAHYPFEAKNIEVEIFFVQPNRKPVADGKLCLIAARRGSLEYEMNDPVTDRLETVHQEPFEEALRLVTQLHQQAI